MTHPLLEALTDAERDQLLAAVTEVTTPPGTTLIVQGGEPVLHLLLDGRVRVVRRDAAGSAAADGEDHELAVLGAGSWVGERAVLGGDATADVETLDELRSLRVDDPAAVRGIDGLVLQLDAMARRRGATHRALELPPLPIGLIGGELVELRPLWPDDWRALEAGQDRVSEASLEQRFFTVPPLTERTFRRLADVDLADQFAWAVLVDGELGAIGRHALQAEDRGVAELAVLVADDLQRHGLGRVLVAAIAAAADVHGADELSAIARSSNDGIRRVLADFGARWVERDDGTMRARWAVDYALSIEAYRSIQLAAADIARTVLHDLTDG